jgi:hypothetical protein
MSPPGRRRDVVPAAPPNRAERATTSRSRLGNRALARLAASGAPTTLREPLQAGNAATAAVVARCKKKGVGKEEEREKKEPKPTKWKVKTSAIVNPQLTVPGGYEKFLAPAGTVYVRSKHPPAKVFKDGFRRREGYDDIVRHTEVDQGFGSNWIATSKSPWIQEDYGAYLYEIQHDGTRGVDVNIAYQTLEKRRNPHAEQEEVAIYKRVPPEWIVAVWETRAETLPLGEDIGDASNYFFPAFVASYERRTRAEALND